MINDKRMMCGGISGDGEVGEGLKRSRVAWTSQALGLGVWYVTNNIMAVT